MSHYLKLKRYGMSEVLQERLQGYRMRVVVEEAVGVNRNIFVYQRKPLTEVGQYTDTFQNIASPADIEEYPIGAPTDTVKPFFRLDAVDLVFRNVTLADESWNVFTAEIAGLIYTLDKMEDLVELEEVEFGTSTSSSSSA